MLLYGWGWQWGLVQEGFCQDKACQKSVTWCVCVGGGGGELSVFHFSLYLIFSNEGKALLLFPQYKPQTRGLKDLAKTTKTTIESKITYNINHENNSYHSQNILQVGCFISLLITYYTFLYNSILNYL